MVDIFSIFFLELEIDCQDISKTKLCIFEANFLIK